MTVHPTDDLGRARCAVDPLSGRQCYVLMDDHTGAEHDFESPAERLLEALSVAFVVTTLIRPQNRTAELLRSVEDHWKRALKGLLP